MRKERNENNKKRGTSSRDDEGKTREARPWRAPGNSHAAAPVPPLLLCRRAATPQAAEGATTQFPLCWPLSSLLIVNV